MRDDLRAPTLTETLVRESLTGRELLRLPLRAPGLRRSPRGSGHPVVLLPGLAATDASLAPLRRFLIGLGHAAHPLGLGRITADVAGTVPRVIERLQGIRDRTGTPVALVGQSIGGVLSRETARERPDLVRRIVTFGTPVVGGPTYTATGSQFTADDLRRIQTVIAERERIPIRVPVTAVWSPNDGIVSPAACIDRYHAHVEHVRVTSSHLGMGFDPDVWEIVAERLAAG